MGSLGGGFGQMSDPIPRHPRGIHRGLAGCHVCEKVSPAENHICPRCGAPLHIRKPNSITRTLALMAAATAMYIPANILPIMNIRELGVLTETTIVEGLIEFWNMGSYPIALVIFTASILIPFLKIISLLWLCGAAKGLIPYSARRMGRIYWMTELLGRWSMVDIFVVAILVAMVQLGNYMTITPGPGALAFAAVVILTMLAAMSFDPKLLWDQLEREESKHKKDKINE